MISNLFNNLNAVDMWITGSIALSSVPCLFPSSIIFSLTNYLMLIFIYNFHLSGIMASSGLLSKADKLTSSIIALESTMLNCWLAKTGAFFYHGALLVMNECIFMFVQTHIHTCMRIHSIIWYFCSASFDPHCTEYHTCAGYFLQTTYGLSFSPLSVTVWSLWARATCLNVVSFILENKRYGYNLHNFPNRSRESMLGNCACLFKVSQSSIISSV